MQLLHPLLDHNVDLLPDRIVLIFASKADLWPFGRDLTEPFLDVNLCPARDQQFEVVHTTRALEILTTQQLDQLLSISIFALV